MTAIAKIEISPVTPNELHHHRELPAGVYQRVLDSFGSELYILRELGTGKLYFVRWRGAEFFREFEITEEGGVRRMDIYERENPS